MEKLKSLLIVSGFILSLVVVIDGAVARTLTATLNPDCPPSICVNSSTPKTLMHVQADGNNDSLHYIWDFSRQPSVLVALTELNTKVSIDWGQLLNATPSALVFSTTPKYTMSFILTKIFIFEDENDSGKLMGVNATDIKTFETQHLSWDLEDWNSTKSEAYVTMAGTNSVAFGSEGVINLKFKCYGSEAHDSDLPHLLHSINVTQIDFEFVNLTETMDDLKKPRVAAEFVLIANESTTKIPFKVSERKTIDDEHTPGIFKLMDIISPDGVNGTRGSYVQFRPISYSERSRDINSQTAVHLSPPDFIIDPATQLNTSLAWSYYGNSLDRVLVQSFNVSFGQKEDGFYTRTNYIGWTVVLGYGYIPPERVSIFVIIIACIGMGIPLILLITGLVYLAIKRMRNC